MLERIDFMPIAYLKKAKYTGSHRGMRFRMEKADQEDGSPCLLVTIWPEPYNYDATPKEAKTEETFDFSEQGIQDGIHWLNEKYGERRWVAEKKKVGDEENGEVLGIGVGMEMN